MHYQQKHNETLNQYLSCLRFQSCRLILVGAAAIPTTSGKQAGPKTAVILPLRTTVRTIILIETVYIEAEILNLRQFDCYCISNGGCPAVCYESVISTHLSNKRQLLRDDRLKEIKTAK